MTELTNEEAMRRERASHMTIIETLRHLYHMRAEMDAACVTVMRKWSWTNEQRSRMQEMYDNQRDALTKVIAML